MRTNTLGVAGPAVSAIGLGTMTFGQETDAGEAHRILDAYVDAGGALVDTADVYAGGVSEEILGKWLADDPARRERVRVATKGRFAVPGQPGAGLSASYLRGALDASLRRLGLPDVDLYQIHGPDRTTPLAEVAGFLTDTLESGRAAYVGVSNLPGWQIAALAALVDDDRLVSHQTQYSLLVREPEWEIFPAAAHAGLGCLVWGPLAAGWLTGKYRRGVAPTGASASGRTRAAALRRGSGGAPSAPGHCSMPCAGTPNDSGARRRASRWPGWRAGPASRRRWWVPARWRSCGRASTAHASRSTRRRGRRSTSCRRPPRPTTPTPS